MKKTEKDPSLTQARAQQTQSEFFESTMADTEAGKIWSEIKDKNISMFALPGQKVQMHCQPVTVDPARLFLKTTSSAVLPSLEMAIGSNYTVELADKFVIVTRVKK